MSKFLSIIEAMVPSKDTTTSVLSAIQKKPDSELSPAEKKVKSAYIQKLNKIASKLQTEEEDNDQVAQEPQPEAQPETMSPEGEVFYVDLIKKALFVDLDNVDLTATEKDVVTTDVTPQNAKEVAEVLRKIISDFGLGV
jgi:SepF-like predicted cell division protein (DUF552 family)